MSPSSAALAFEAEMAMAHIPVLTSELMGLLQVEADSRVVDCTFGAGGHASAVAAHLGAQGLLIACDRDPVAEAYFETMRQKFHSPARFCAGNFADTLAYLRESGFSATHVYMDLGLSSMQVDTEERGFSYGYDAPLDMRMDPALDVTAADIINGRTEAELSHIFRAYGEEQYARQIARAVVRRRQRAPFERTAELVETVKQAIPTPARFGARNPARRVFQALRIAVNDELESLRRALPEALGLLEPGGVLAVISFHSLEDRIVKQFFQSQARPCICPPSLPVCACGRVPTMEILTPRPLIPKARERQANPRSSSAKLRAARRL
jgi:16S rRNA (cytosine1402-N4)-methyltransferase